MTCHGEKRVLPPKLLNFKVHKYLKRRGQKVKDSLDKLFGETRESKLRWSSRNYPQ